MTVAWGTVPQWISAAASCTALVIAWIATTTWRSTLKGKRGDDLLIAIFGLARAVASTIDMIVRSDSRAAYSAHVSQLNSIAAELERTFVVAMRSYSDLDEKKLREVTEMILTTTYIAGDIHDMDGNIVVTSQQPATVYYMNLRDKVEKFKTYLRDVIR